MPTGAAIIVSISGGKDGLAALLELLEHYPPHRMIAHYQAMPEDWPESLPYNQEACRRLGVRLVAQQILYEPAGPDTGTHCIGVRDIHSAADIVPWGTPGVIAGITDLALRRGWPPSAGVRWCTSYFKERLLDIWIRENQAALGPEIVVVLGERAAESPRRARKRALWPRFRRRAYTVWNWLPVFERSRRQVFRTLRDWGLDPHPAYRAQGLTPHQMLDQDTEGGPRTSCRACIYATHADLCHQAQSERNLGLFDRLVEVEELTGRTWWHQRSARTYRYQ